MGKVKKLNLSKDVKTAKGYKVVDLRETMEGNLTGVVLVIQSGEIGGVAVACQWDKQGNCITPGHSTKDFKITLS